MLVRRRVEHPLEKPSPCGRTGAVKAPVGGGTIRAPENPSMTFGYPPLERLPRSPCQDHGAHSMADASTKVRRDP